jgi:arylsulfatase A-like enzyme
MKVLFVIARGLRPDLVGAYGNGWVETPTLDALAVRAAVFDQHLADRTDPAGALCSWRTGRYDLAGVAGPGGADLLDRLRAAGVHTRLVLDASRPVSAGFAAGWGEAERVEPGTEETALEAVCAATERALDELPPDGWLLGLSLASLLPPWEVPEDFLAPYFHPATVEGEDEEEGESAEEPLEPMADPGEEIDPEDDRLFLQRRLSCAAAVSYLDAGLGQVLEGWGPAGEEVAVVLTADAGLPLGEHGVVGTGRPGLHHEMLHLPLMVRLPGMREGRRISALTQAVDLAPTLAELFGVQLAGAHGRSLLPLVRGETEAVRPYACSAAPPAGGLALRTARWAFLLPGLGSGPARLYVKPDDRWEVNDVLQHQPERGEQLEQVLRAFVAASASPGPLTYPELDLEGERAEEAGAQEDKQEG